MARNPFWDTAMNCSKFSACLTTHTLENQSSLNQNFVKSCWMSAEGYFFFFVIKVCQKKIKEAFQSNISWGNIFLNHFFFSFQWINIWKMFIGCLKLSWLSNWKWKLVYCLSNSVTKRDKKLMKIFRFLSFVRFICIL